MLVAAQAAATRGAVQVGAANAHADDEFTGARRGGHLVEPGADAAVLQDKAGDDAGAVAEGDEGE